MKKIVIFGASGNLAKIKLMPALSRLNYSTFEVIAFARSNLKNCYSDQLRKHHSYNNNFPENVRYIQGDYKNLSSLKDIVDKDTIYYFSTPPSIYQDLLVELSNLDFDIVGIEKPFGEDYEAFKKLFCFKERRLNFIDHYLVKPLLISIPEILYEDKRISEILNNTNISYVEAYFNESITANARMYFEKTGIIKDVMLNHLIVILTSLILPSHEQSENESDYRAEILKKMKINSETAIFGQYDGYQDELGIESITETFSCFKIDIDSEQWRKVPFILMAGKALKEKRVEAVFNIKKLRFKFILNKFNLKENEEEIEKLNISFKVAPVSEIYLQIVKKNKEIVKIILYDENKIDTIMEREYGSKRGYEVIFHSLLNDKPVYDSKLPEIAEQWKLYDELISKKSRDLFFYKEGVILPDEAIKFLEENIPKELTE